MTRMTGLDCAVMCNLIKTNTHTAEGCATKDKEIQIEHAVDSSWAALAADEDPQE